MTTIEKLHCEWLTFESAEVAAQIKYESALEVSKQFLGDNVIVSINSEKCRLEKYLVDRIAKDSGFHFEKQLEKGNVIFWIYETGKS